MTKPVIDAICGGSFISKTFLEDAARLDKVSKNNRVLHTREYEVEGLGFTFEMSPE